MVKDYAPDNWLGYAPYKPKTNARALLLLIIGTLLISAYIYKLGQLFTAYETAQVNVPAKHKYNWFQMPDGSFKYEIINIDEMSVESQIRYYSEREHYDNPDYLISLATCESSLRANVTGQQGEQGAFQIHPYFHPNVNGYDLEEATIFTINQLKQGNARLWTCASKI